MTKISVRMKFCLPLVVSLVSFFLEAGCAVGRDPHFYGVYMSRLDGSDMRLILSSSWQEMTHARVSKDGQWITCTRYRHIGADGTASEEGGYDNTEVLIARVDGSQVQTIVPAKDGVANANSSWTPDGRGLLYCSNDNPQHLPQEMIIDLKTSRVRKLPTPPGLRVADPHWVGRRVVFSVVEKDRSVLWMMNDDGSQARQLTNPHFPGAVKRGTFPPGDCDPWLSPDGQKVACMRLTADGTWHSIVVDANSSREQDLTAGIAGNDAVPEWSGDGKLLLVWHANPKDFAGTGIWSMHSDGTARKMVRLPRGYLQMHPGFFPCDGSSPQARIIFNARTLP
jgi:Tol biopolymer transport system component